MGCISGVGIRTDVPRTTTWTDLGSMMLGGRSRTSRAVRPTEAESQVLVSGVAENGKAPRIGAPSAGRSVLEN